MWKKSLDLKARQSLSFSHCHVQLFATLWTVAHQAPLFMGFSRQEYFSGLPFPPPGGIFLIKEWNLRLLHWQADSLPLSYQGSLGRPDSKSCRCLGVWGGNTWAPVFSVEKKEKNSTCIMFCRIVLNINCYIDSDAKESACQCRRLGFNPWVRKIPWRRKWQPTPVFLPEEFHGQRSLVGCIVHGAAE